MERGELAVAYLVLDLAGLHVAVVVAAVGLEHGERGRLPSAKRGETARVWNETVRASRPNSETNQGIPAAGTQAFGSSSVAAAASSSWRCKRSAARSSTAWRSAAVTFGFEVSKTVASPTQRRRSASPGVSAARSSSQGRTTRRSSPSITAIHHRQRCHEPFGSSAKRNSNPPFANSGDDPAWWTSATNERSNVPFWYRVVRMPASSSQSLWIEPRRIGRSAFTSKRSAKSDSMLTSRSTTIRSRPWFVTS